MSRPRHLGDFTITPRALGVCVLAIPIGAIAAVGAWCLLRLIGLCTNVFFSGRLSTALVAPAANTTRGSSSCSSQSQAS